MEKLRKAMRKEDGFTLVELLAVIVILGIILAIAIPAIGNVISNARDSADDQEEALIIDAARLYIVGEGLEVPTVTDEDAEGGLVISVQEDLVAKGYLENIENDVTGNVTAKKIGTGPITYEYKAGVEAGDEAGDEDGD